MAHKITAAIICAIALTATKSYGQMEKNQETPNGKVSEYESFREVRRNEFLKLSGTENNFEGLVLDYDKDKAALRFNKGVGFEKKGVHTVIFSATLGTSTDISTLFSQDVLPIFSLGATYNWMIPGKFSVWFVPSNKGGKKKKGAKLYNEIVAEKSAPADDDASKYTYRYLHWLSGSVKYTNDQYGFFDASRAINDQQYDVSFGTVAVQGGISGYYGWNHKNYMWKLRPQYIYWTLNATYSKANNISRLDKVTVQHVTARDTVSGTEREIIRKSQNYYTGQYIEFDKFSISGKATLSPFKYLALTIFGDYNFIGGYNKSLYSLNNYAGIGAGFFVYTGNKDKFNVNIGLNYKYSQSLGSNDWNKKIELVTSIPLGMK